MNTTTVKPRTFHADLTKLPAALLPLTKLRRWVVWKWEQRGGKWTKPPYNPEYYNEHAESDEPGTWGTYEEAVLAFAAGHCDGIGFMLKDSELGAIDLDHIRDFATGQVLPWAEELFAEAAKAGCYVEWTVSGTGARVIGIARGSELHKKINLNRNTDCAVEFYRHCARYITVSGAQISKYPGPPLTDTLKDYDALFDAFYARFCDGQRRPPAEVCGFAPGLHLTGELAEASESPAEFDLDLNNAGPQIGAEYEDLIQNGAPIGSRSEQFQRVVCYLAQQGWSPEQIAEELAKYPNGIGEKYAGRLRQEVQRSYDKFCNQQQAVSGGGGVIAGGGVPTAGSGVPAGGGLPPQTGANTPWPHIIIKPGEIPRIVNEAEDALLLLEHEIYQRDGMLVRPVLKGSLKTCTGSRTASWQLTEITHSYLRKTFCCAARWLRYDKRAKGLVQIDPPDKIVETYLNQRGDWKLPALAGVVNAPFLRSDGSICETPGYDRESYVLFKPQGQAFPPVPQYPSKADAEAALKKLCQLIETFPFVTLVDRSVTLAGMLTTLDRRAMATAPMIGFTAPMPRTGKSLLVDATNILATGRQMPVTSQGPNDEEFDKRLGGDLLAGALCISIDNCVRPVSGDVLCQVLTQNEVNVRILGHNRNISTATIATIFVNGNNLVIAGDLTDRCILASLDAKTEWPGLRKFKIDVVKEAHARGGELVVAALTILRAWHVAREAGEQVNVDPLGGFEEWSRRVREALIWLGEPDPCNSMGKVRGGDPELEELTTVIEQWKLHLTIGAAYTVQEVIGRAVNSTPFHTALMNVAAASGSSSVVSNRRLGRWLKRIEGRIVNGFKLSQVGSTGGYPKWSLKR